VDILTDKTYQTANAGDDPITGGASDTLAGLAASITVLAVKTAGARE